MSGVELLRRVLVERLRIKVLYVSGYTDSGIINQGFHQEMRFFKSPLLP